MIYTNWKPKVSMTIVNIKKCACSKCPVQANSKCVKSELGKLKEAMTKNPLRKEDIPNVYCSTGTATCKDLDSHQMCMCSSCLIWSEYKLTSRKPKGYFCRDGAVF